LTQTRLFRIGKQTKNGGREGDGSERRSLPGAKETKIQIRE
jgi:hypothetical protein